MLNGVWSNQGGPAARCEIPQVPIPAGSHTQQSKYPCPNSSVGYRTAMGQRIGRSGAWMNMSLTTMTTIAVTASTSAKLANSRLQVSTSETLGRGLAVIQDIPAGCPLF